MKEKDLCSLFSLTNEQRKCVEELQNAFKRCQDAGLFFVKIDSELFCLDKNRILDAPIAPYEYEEGDVYMAEAPCLSSVDVPEMKESANDDIFFRPVKP